ncbi:MAG TPA: efflux RND transporter permease subunit [Candidatus Dormibacteraeota bacterium]|nr:efflux RND transporter permease subunit [Candidatus Dormibacteraeota bacterium]
MWIVRLALRRPYTFTVAAILIVLMGIVTIPRMATDIFPKIDIPVVSVIWSFPGVAPEEMEKRFVTVTERAMTTTVNDIEHIESQSYNGVSVIKVFFHEGAKVEAGVAQVTSITQTLLRILPPGTTPPLILQYSASNVPILQLGLTSKTLSEQQLYDLGLNFIRTQLATVQGAQVPLPYGGKSRQVMVDIDPQKLFGKGLSPADVSNALNAQNVILPAGTQKIGDREYNVRLNSSPELLQTLNDLPIKQVNNAMVYIRDVAHVRDGFAVQTNIVAQNRVRSALLTVLKSASASTLDIISQVKAALPRIKATLPPELDITQLFDQSIFVRAAINGVVKEGVIAACLTALMILLFLGSWRSTLVVATSIPLSILCSVIILSALGQTLNLMTLGGLALAVGILVDDATVEIENIHRNLAMKKPMVRAILDGASQIAVPAFVSTLCICIVFVPIFFLSGTARFLFQPLAMAVIFAMLASYLLSRTVVPTMVRFLLREHLDEIDTSLAQSVEGSDGGEEKIVNRSPENPTAPRLSALGQIFGFLSWIHEKFNHVFEKLRACYVNALRRCLEHRRLVFGAMGGMVLVSFALVPFLGRDFFPAVDAGQFRLHVRAPAGTRLESTQERFFQVGNAIREVIPPNEIQNVLDNIGLPSSGINLAFGDSSTISSADGEILVALNPNHKPTAQYVRILREKLHRDFPDMEFFFSAPDIVGQILNFGIPAPIDIQITGRDPKGYDIANEIKMRVAQIPGAVDTHVHQLVHGPDLRVNVNRTRAEQIGLTQNNVAQTMLISLSSSGQTAPNYWLNFQNGVNYQVAVQTPQYKMDTLQDLKNTPVVAPNLPRPELLGNLATVERRESPVIVNHYNVQPVFDVLANVQGRDLGGVADGVAKVVDSFKSKLPRGTFLSIRGQVQSMNSSFAGLGAGLIFAIVLVYFLMAVNFQSWTDPFIIIMALPGALCGIIWMLFITGTTLNVPSLMGAIMAIGVATANSILIVTFANDERCAHENKNAFDAALAAGFTRLRPVIMTALAMIIGMLPMSLGLGEGGEQNAPLGRAVIGGLLVATVTTLFFVPVVYSLLRKKEFTCDEDEEFARQEHGGTAQGGAQ